MFVVINNELLNFICSLLSKRVSHMLISYFLQILIERLGCCIHRTDEPGAWIDGPASGQRALRRPPLAPSGPWRSVAALLHGSLEGVLVVIAADFFNFC